MRQDDDAAERGVDSADNACRNPIRCDDRRLIIDTLSRLSAGQRAVILRSFYMGWTTTQIAADLNITDSAVKSSQHDALRALGQRVSTREKNELGAPEYPKSSGR